MGSRVSYSQRKGRVRDIHNRESDAIAGQRVMDAGLLFVSANGNFTITQLR